MLEASEHQAVLEALRDELLKIIANEDDARIPAATRPVIIEQDPLYPSYPTALPRSTMCGE